MDCLFSKPRQFCACQKCCSPWTSVQGPGIFLTDQSFALIGPFFFRFFSIEKKRTALGACGAGFFNGNGGVQSAVAWRLRMDQMDQMDQMDNVGAP